MCRVDRLLYLFLFVVLFFVVAAFTSKSDFLLVFLPFDSHDLSIVRNIIPSKDEGNALLSGKVSVAFGVRGNAADFIHKKGFYRILVPERWVHMPEGVSIGLYIYSRGIDKDSVIVDSPFLVVRGDEVYPDRLQVEVYFDDGDREIVHLPVEIPKRKWVNLAVGVGEGIISVFVNGQLIYQDICWGRNLRKDDIPIRDEIFLASDGSGKNTFDGKIDEFSLFSHRLTDYEAAALV